jgi:hypothetical protein
MSDPDYDELWKRDTRLAFLITILLAELVALYSFVLD